MKRHILSVLGYVLGTLITQATSHFVVNTSHYAAVTFMKPTPIFPLGLASMVIQGTVLSVIYAGLRVADGRIWSALKVSWMFGAFLVSYIALAEAAKYVVPSVPSWILVESVVGFLQFTIIGTILGLAHRHRSTMA